MRNLNIVTRQRAASRRQFGFLCMVCTGTGCVSRVENALKDVPGPHPAVNRDARGSCPMGSPGGRRRRDDGLAPPIEEAHT